MKRFVRLFLLITIISLTMCSCQPKSAETSADEEATKTTVTTIDEYKQEFKLLAAHVECGNVTDKKGYTESKKYIHYVFETSSGEVMIKTKEICENYYGTYKLKFREGDENKIIQYDGSPFTTLEFVMTEEMYSKIFEEVEKTE